MTDQFTSQSNVPAEDEPLPFLSNFQDIFLTVGLIIFLVGVSIFAGRIGANMDGVASWVLILGLILVVVWFLSEVIVRKRRRILPGIVLCLTFLSLAWSIFLITYTLLVGDDALDQLKDLDWEGANLGGATEITSEVIRSRVNEARDMLPWSVKGFILIAPAFMFAMAVFYYRRFRLPFASAMSGLAAVVFACAVLFFLSPYDVIRFSPTVVFLSGLGLLVMAIYYDMKDPARETRWSGNGFWLHFVAAPLLLGGALAIARNGFAFDVLAVTDDAFNPFEDNFSVRQSVVTLIVIGVFAIISLLLNRRALLVAGLVSSGVAIGVIVNASGLGGAEVAAVTMMLLGGGILLLGLGWNSARRFVLAFVPNEGIFRRIFPRETADG